MRKQSAVNFQPGDRITIQGKPGTVRYFGKTGFAPGVWVGVEMETPEGKNDGCVKDQRYFTCPQNHGRFVRPERVKRADPPSSSSSNVGSRRISLATQPMKESGGEDNNETENIDEKKLSSDSTTQNKQPSEEFKEDHKQESPHNDTHTHADVSIGKEKKDNTIISDNDAQFKPTSKTATDSAKDSGSLRTITESKSDLKKQDQEGKTSTEREVDIRRKLLSDMRMKRDRARSEQTLAGNNDRVRELENENEQLRSRHEKEVNELKSQLRKAEQMTTNLSERMTKTNAQVKEYSKRLEQERHRFEEKENDLSFRVESLELDKELAEERANVAESDLEALKQQFRALEEQYDSMVKQKSLEDQVSSSGDIEGVVKQNQQLKEALMELYQVKTDLESRIENMQSEIDKVDSLKERIKELEGYREELAKAKNTIQDLELQVEANAESNAMIEDLAAEKLDLEDKVADLTRSLEEMEEMKQLSDEVEGIQAEELRKLGEEAQHATAKATHLSEQLERQQQILSERENTIERFRTALHDTEARLQELQEAHADTVSESSTIQQRSKEMHDNYNLLLSKVAKLRYTQIKQRIAEFEAESYRRQLEDVNAMLPENVVDVDVGVVRTLASASRVDYKIMTAIERIRQDADIEESSEMADAAAHRVDAQSAGHMCFLLNMARMYVAGLRSWAGTQHDMQEYLQIRRHNLDLCSAENHIDDILRKLAHEELTDAMFLESVRLLLDKVGKLAIYFNDPRWTWMRVLVAAVRDETAALRNVLKGLIEHLEDRETEAESMEDISTTVDALDHLLQRQRYLHKVSDTNAPVNEVSVETIMQCLASCTALFTAAYHRSRRIVSLVQDIKAGYRDAASSELISELDNLYTLTTDMSSMTNDDDNDNNNNNNNNNQQETTIERRRQADLRLYDSLEVLKPIVGGLARRAEHILESSRNREWNASSHVSKLADGMGDVADIVLKHGDDDAGEDAQGHAAQQRAMLVKEELGSVRQVKVELAQTTEKLSQIRESHHKLQNQLQHVEAENDRLQTELETSNRKVQQYEQMDSYIADIDSLREEMKQVEQENAELKTRYQEMEHENAKLTKENEAMEAQTSSASAIDQPAAGTKYVRHARPEGLERSLELLLWERHRRKAAIAADDLADVMDMPVEHLSDPEYAAPSTRGQTLAKTLQDLSTLTHQVQDQYANVRLINAKHKEAEWADVCRRTSQIREKAKDMGTRVSHIINTFHSDPPGQGARLLSDKTPKLAGRVSINGRQEGGSKIPVVLPASKLSELHQNLISV